MKSGMHRRTTYFLFISLLGCADVTTGPVISPVGHSPRHDETSDPASEWPVSINSMRASVVFEGGQSVKIDASMNYNAYHASIAGQGVVQSPSGSATTFNFGVTERHQFWNFRNQDHSAVWYMNASGLCGNYAQANIEYKAWWQGLSGSDGGWKLEEAVQNTQPNDSQDPCPTRQEDEPAESAGSGGGMGDCPTCIETPNTGATWCRVRYTYDIQTGEIYEATILYCW